MTLKKPVFLPFLLLFLSGQLCAQIGIGQWRDHLPYRKGVAVTYSPEKVWCATSDGLFELNKSDNSITRLNKYNGLSDVGANDIKYNPSNGTVVVGYSNGNLDVIDGNSIYNISDIKRAPIVGSKTINTIYTLNDYAYLACGFGIVVIDTRRREVKDTYYLGINGGYINVRDITTDAANIYAATDSGVYVASLSDPNLANFAVWSKFSTLPSGIYNTIQAFNGKVYVNYSKRLTSGSYSQDTVFIYNGSAWGYNYFTDVSGYNCYSIEIKGNYIAYAMDGYVDVFNSSDALVDHVWTYLNSFVQPRQAVMEASNLLWIADAGLGLVRVENTWTANSFYPNGPATSNVYGIDIKNKNVFVVPGAHNELWDNSNSFNTDGIFYQKNNTWYTIERYTQTIIDSVRDIVCVAIDPNNPDHAYAGSLGEGLIEVNNGVVTNMWHQGNSSLQVRGDNPSSGWVGVFGAAFDEDGNLWVTNSKAQNPISVRKTDGSWQSFNLGPNLSQLTIDKIIATKIGQKWAVLPRSGGILVFDNGPDITNTSDDQVKKLNTSPGNGGLPSNEIFCLTEDHDGEIWVGTDKGIAVFYSPENVFTNNNFDAQQILVQQDGHTQILLETEIVTAIAIDGANRKWIGTQSSGVFLMSADGQTQIYHFDESNSPLISNSITSIAIDGESGEVYFGTSRGLISYRSTATEGLDDFTDVYAFPNPVHPEYNGVIAIRGLVKDCDVKITDITGNIVYQTTALGGQAIWDGKNFRGDRVHTGVFLVFCSNEDGSKKYVTKILVIN